MVFHCLNYITSYFIAIIGFYIVGHIVLNLGFTNKNTPLKFYYTIFIKLLIGLVSSILVFSILVSHGKTINVLLIVPIFYYVNKKFDKRDIRRDLLSFAPKPKEILAISILSSVILFLQFFNFADLKEAIQLHPDLHAYSDISLNLLSGNENTFGSLNHIKQDNFSSTHTPYHYFEIWLNAFLASIFTLKHGYSFLYVAYPILITIFTIGIFSIWEFFNTKITPIIFIISFSFLFTEAFGLTKIEYLFLDSANKFELQGLLNHLSIFDYFGQKHLPFYLFSLFFILTSLQSNKIEFEALTFVFIINSGLIPNITIGFFVFVLYHKTILKKELIDYRSGLKYILIMLASFYLFYKLIPTSACNTNYFQPAILYHFFNDGMNVFQELKRAFDRINFLLIWLINLYFPLLIFLLYYWKKKHSFPILFTQIIKFSFFIIATGIFTRPFVKGLDSGQFFTLLLPMLNTMIIVIMIVIYSQNKWGFFFLFICFSISNCLYTINKNIHNKKKYSASYSSFYMNSVLKKLENTNSKIGYFVSDKQMININPEIWAYIKPGSFIQTEDHFEMYALNDFTKFKYPNLNYSGWGLYEYKYPVKLLMNRDDNHSTKDFISYKIALKKFIQSNNIKFIITSKCVSDKSSFFEFINDSLVDPKSHEVFYELK